MNRDQFYQQILDRLAGQLDPDIFEACACDLLRDTYPGLVPMRGGNDAGMDGAVGDGEGEPFPLITTTEERVIRNLAKSLQSYIISGRKRRKAILATSLELTPRRKQNLFDRADKFGFTLINVHTREDFANRLYHSPKWCRELLNLTGRPPALSVFPKSDRPLLNKNIIGRDADIAWLRDTHGDRLLVGQPGSGKSYLLHRYAKEGGGLFVVDEDREEIANGLRSQEPPVLIVDDAQIHLPLLSDLIHMRQELGAEFSILASCWHGDKELVKAVLNLTESSVHLLELLPRPQIVDVIYDAGLGGPVELIRKIVDQAEGRPGLAATLANLCLLGGVKEVVLGDALKTSVRKYFEPRLGSKAIDVLAAFGVGGDVGMMLRTVADGLQLSITDVHRIVVELDAGGILWETHDEYLSVNPPTLRQALVRDVFFQGGFSLPIQTFIERSSDIGETACTLISASALGAKIPEQLLISVIEQAGSSDVWEMYAWLGPREAALSIRNHPELTVPLARPALSHIPEIALPLLFQASIGDDRQLHATPEHPLRIIEDWVKSARPGSNQTLIYRDILIKKAIDWLKDGGDPTPAFQAMSSAFNPTYEEMITDPGSEDKVTIQYAYLLPDEMMALRDRWAEVIQVLKSSQQLLWQPLRDIVHRWAYPELHGIQIPDSTRKLMRSFTRQMLVDITSIEPKRQGILHWAKQNAKITGIGIQIELDPEFETLYPIEERRDWKESEKKHSPLVHELAVRWSKQIPEEVAIKIAQIEQEAQMADIRWPRWTPNLCYNLAKMVSSPDIWATAFIEENCTGDLVLPFLQKSAENNRVGWPDLALKCLAREDLRWVAISVGLTISQTPDDLLIKILDQLSGYEQIVMTHCLRGEVPEVILKRLLLHQDAQIASAAAHGEWVFNQQKGRRANLIEEWRNAVIRSRDDYFVSMVLPGDSGLAFDWITGFLKEETLKIYEYERAVGAAVSVLDKESRVHLLEILPPKWRFNDLISHLIDNDIDLYHVLLQNSRLKRFHLIPLTWQDGEIWIEKAKLAMEKGYSAKDVAYAAYGQSSSWVGNESIVRKEWVERFSKLCLHEDKKIHEVGTVGKAIADAQLKDALHREREEEIFGRRISRRKRL